MARFLRASALVLAGDAVGVEGGHVGHGQDLAGAGAHHHHRARLGLVLAHGPVQGLLGHVLEVLVDGEDQVGAGLGRLQGAPSLGDGPSLRVPFEQDLARVPAEQPVVLLLDAGLAVAVDVDEAEHLGGDRARRVAAGHGAFHEDAGQVQPLDDVAPGLGDAPDQVDEAALGGQAPGQGRLLDAEDLGQAGGGSRLVLDQAGVRPDRPCRDGDGQVVEVAVEDAAAGGGQVDHGRPLAGRGLVEGAGVEHLEDDQPPGDGQEGQHAQDQQGQQAPPAVDPPTPRPQRASLRPTAWRRPFPAAVPAAYLPPSDLDRRPRVRPGSA